MNEMQNKTYEAVINALVFTDKLVCSDVSDMCNGDKIVSVDFVGVFGSIRSYYFIISKKGNTYFYNKNHKKQYVGVHDIYSKCAI